MEFSWPPEPLQKFIELSQQDARILRTLVSMQQGTAFEMILDLPGNAARHRALQWIAAEQLDHAAARQKNVQSRLWLFSGKDLHRIPCFVGCAERAHP